LKCKLGAAEAIGHRVLQCQHCHAAMDRDTSAAFNLALVLNEW
jgi:transposase